MKVSPGTRVGSYEVGAPLGVGGMGEVYRARDTKLDRAVALKVLPKSFAHDPDRLTRFDREAKTLAALNHPHIAQIYGVEQSPSGSALVMELVEGEDLAARIARGALPLDEALPIARQIADALEAAHEASIIHRDLKPANIKVRPDSTVKVLDFGLAKPMMAGSTADAAVNDTVTSPAMTMHGVILGTAAYMSPEQARGKSVDRRTDIWAFGCVLFEMLTGRRAFEGDDVTVTLAAVVTSEPDWSRLPASTPASVRLLLRRCLAKNPNERLPHIGVARLELNDAPAVPPPAELRQHRSRARRWMTAALPLVLASGIGAGWWGASRLTSTPAAPPYRSTLFFRDARLAPVMPTGRFALSPDGRRLAFVATDGGRNQLWLRSLNELTAQRLADLRVAGGGAPFWSPDGKHVAFFSNGQLLRVDTADGAPTMITESPAFRQQMPPGAWSPDGVIVVTHGRTLARVAASGGTLEPLTTLDEAAGESYHSYPHFLPDGQHLLYTAYRALTPVAVYAIRLDRPSERQKVMDGGSNVQYAEGALLYLRGNTLMAQPFDPSRRTLTGEGVAIADSVLSNVAVHFAGAFSASRTGALVHQDVREQGFSSSSTLVWRTPSGEARTFVDEAETYRHLAIPPDGRNALVTRLNADGRSDLWSIDLARGVRTRVALTQATSQLSGAVWSADGTTFVVNLTDGNGLNLYRKPNASTGVEQLLFADERPKMPQSISPDGRFLLYDIVGIDTGGDIWVLPLDEPAKAAPFVNTPYFERFAQFSPDGKWVAYASDESGAIEIYVRAFPGGHPQVRISASGGDVPRWSRDGNQLFFHSNGRMMAAKVSATGSTFDVASVTPLFECRAPEGFRRMFYDVMPDGRFLLMTPAAGASPTSLTLTVNWPQLRQADR